MAKDTDVRFGMYAPWESQHDW